MKKILCSLVLLWATACSLLAQGLIPYGFTPDTIAAERLSAVGSGKSNYTAGLICLDPTQDSAVARLKGQQVKGVRCYLRAAYKQKSQKRSCVMAALGTPGNVVAQTYVNFTAGWNDVLFEEPVTLGDEPLYVGAQVYETAGTPYPLGTYGGVSVPEACWVNLDRAGWTSYNNHGALLMAALIDESAATKLARTVYVKEYSHPQTVAPDADFDGELYVMNQSNTAVHSLEISMQGEGAATATTKTLTLETPLPAYGATTLTTALRAGSKEGNPVSWTVRATKVDGQDAQPARAGESELYVTQDNFIRTPLIEEFTSQYCINCPQMLYFLDKAFEQYDSAYVYVAHHSGFANDAFTADVDLALDTLFNIWYGHGNPAIMYNRAVMPGQTTTVLGTGAHDNLAAPYLAFIRSAAASTAAASVNIDLQRDGSQLGVRVKGRVSRAMADKDLYLSVYLCEDSIKAYQMGVHSDRDADAPEDLVATFHHNGVVRAYYNTDIFGDALELGEDNTYDVTYPAQELDSSWVETNLRVVAIVHRVNRTNVDDNEALNAGQAWLARTSGIASTTTKGEASPTVYDLQGRRLGTSIPQRRGLYVSGGRKVLVP